MVHNGIIPILLLMSIQTIAQIQGTLRRDDADAFGCLPYDPHVYLHTNNYSGSGSTWEDQSGNDYDGTLTLGVSWDATNELFDLGGTGNNYRIEIGDVGIPFDHITIEIEIPFNYNSSTTGRACFNYADNSTINQGWCAFGSTSGFSGAEVVSLGDEDPATVFGRTYNRTYLSSSLNPIVLTFNWNGSYHDIFYNGVKQTVYASSDPGGGYCDRVQLDDIVIGTTYDEGSRIFLYSDFDVRSFIVFDQTLTDQECEDLYDCIIGL